MERIFAKLLYELEKGRDSVLVSIVDDQGSAPRGTGSQMLVGGCGRLLGTIGGGAVEKLSEEAAMVQLEKKENLLRKFELHKGAQENIGMVCGGDVTVLFQYIPGGSEQWRTLAARVKGRIDEKQAGWLTIALDGSCPGLLDENGTPILGGPVPGTVTHRVWLPDRSENGVCLPLPIGERVFLFGAGHCAYALAPLLTTVGFRVTVYDDRQEYCSRDRFPNVEERIVDDFRKLSEHITITPQDYAVVMTSGHSFDLEVQDQLLRQPMAYVGVIGSKSKRAAVNQKLRERGHSEEAIQSVHSPIGISIKAVTPEEIAVSIAAEMISVRGAYRESQGITAKGCPMK